MLPHTAVVLTWCRCSDCCARPTSQHLPSALSPTPPHPTLSYVLDTGIRFTHTEFRTQGGAAVRARHGFSVFGDNNSTDCNGHGTHTAATVRQNFAFVS